MPKTCWTSWSTSASRTSSTYGTNHAANDHASKGCTHNFFFNLRHIAKARLLGPPSLPTTTSTSPGDEDASHGGADCCSWPRASRHRPTSTNHLAEEEVVRGRMRSKFGELDSPSHCWPRGHREDHYDTTHIYHSDDSEGKEHFSVKIWVRVPRKFNLDKLLEDIKGHIPGIEGENGVSAGELIEQRLKSSRFFLVLDDMWECGEDDWKYLLQPFQNSQTKGSMILVTTRVPSLAHMVKTVEKPCELEGLEPKEFKELFLAFVFDGNDPRKYDERLTDVGDQIMVKLKGSPLAAKIVCGILKGDIKFGKWGEVLESKQWEMGSNAADIMPALKLCYDYLSFELKQCFSSTALFPEDFKFSSKKLIHFWIGLNILHCGDTRKTIEDIGMRNLNELVSRGLLKKEETSGDPYFIVHDLLHDLALMVSSHESLTLHSSSVEPKDCQLCIRHLSIIIYVEGIEDLKGKLRELIKDKFKVEGLRTLMVFGEIDEGFANIFGDLFSAAKAFRVLHLDTIDYPVESILQKLSELVHLRYLFLGTNRRSRMHLPNTISRFYHLQIFDIEEWYGFIDFPRDMSNLRKLCHFVTRDRSVQSCIGDVGKLTHLQELKAFEVNKESKGFEAKQLERLNELRELGIYDLEKIVSKEEAAQTKLREKKYLQRLTLVWTKERPSTSTSTAPDEKIPSGVPDEERLRAELALEREVLESLEPHEDLQALSITGHRGHSCPTWLGDVLVALESLHLSTVSWEDLPCFAKMRYLGDLVLSDIATEKKIDVEHTFCYLTRLILHDLRSLEDWVPRETNCFPILGELSISGCPRLLRLPFSDLQDRNKAQFPMLQSLSISNCPEVSSLPPVPWTQNFNYVSMESTGSNILKRLEYRKDSSGAMLEITVNIDLRHLDQVVVFNELTKVEYLRIVGSGDLPMPLRAQSDREWKIPVKSIWLERDNCSGKELTWLLRHCPDLSELSISGYAPRTPLVVEGGAKDKQQRIEEGDMVVLPAHLSTTLEELEIHSRNIVVYPLHALKTLKTLECSPASFSKYFCPFPASLQRLKLENVSCAGLANLTSLTELCIHDSRILFEGLHTLCELRELIFMGSPNFLDRTRDHLLSSASSKLQSLRTDDIARILTLPVGRFLSSSLTDLTFDSDKNVVRFDKGQEEVLHLLTSLKKLEFSHCRKLQHLPDGLCKLSKLESLTICFCYSLDSLDANGLPSSLQLLDVIWCNNRKLREQCEKLTGKIKAEVKLAYNDFA
uniref:Uncharacterized protein n=1 Tax=Avena sativa TaxID=4498 RepID=A0ACD5TCU8_AVESA